MRQGLQPLIACLMIGTCCFGMPVFHVQADSMETHIDFARARTNMGFYNVDVTLDQGKTWLAPGTAAASIVRLASTISATYIASISSEGHPILVQWDIATQTAHQVNVPDIICQNGVSVATVTATIPASLAVVCATPVTNTNSTIVINVLNGTTGTWGGWQIIGGWSRLSTDNTRIPVPSISGSSYGVDIIVKSPDTFTWNMTYLWGGQTTQWRPMDWNSCTATPLLDQGIMACIARDTLGIWIASLSQNLYSGSGNTRSIWLNTGSMGGGFRDLALTHDNSGRLYISGLGLDHTVYTYTASNAFQWGYPMLVSWQRQFADPNLSGIASAIPNN